MVEGIIEFVNIDESLDFYMSVKKRRRGRKKRTGIDQVTANKIIFEKEVEILTNEFLNNPDHCPLLENSDYLLEYDPDTFRDLDHIKELDGQTIVWDREKEELVNMKREIFLQWAKENDETGIWSGDLLELTDDLIEEICREPVRTYDGCLVTYQKEDLIEAREDGLQWNPIRNTLMLNGN